MTKHTTTVAAFGALVCAAGVFYWAHGLGLSSHVSKASPPVATSATPQIRRRWCLLARHAAKSIDSTDRPDSVEAATPLHAGEVLEFAADVAKLSNVANLRLQIVERRNFFGKSAWHLQAFAHTENPLRMMFELDDQFDSYSDAATLSSLQYEMHLSERGEKQESIQRMITNGTESAAPNATQTHVVPGRATHWG